MLPLDSRLFFVGLVLSIVSAMVVFGFDLTQPLGIAAGVAQVFPLLIGLVLKSRVLVVVSGVLGVSLIVTGWILSAPAGNPGFVAWNRSLSIGVVAVVAVVSYFYIESQLRLTKTLRELAETDPLTGVGNRRYLLSKLELTHKQAAQRDGSHGWAILMVSFDQYADIKNDFGYRRADKVLAHVVEIIQKQLIQGQIIARYSGESFAIVYPDIDALGAREFGECLRSAVENSKPFEGKLTTTISVGYSASNGHESSPLILLSQADQALYCSRERGMNCVNSVVGLKALATAN